MVDWKNLLIGVVISIVLASSGLISSYIAPIIAAMYMGYVVFKDYNAGASYGAQMGALTGIVLVLGNVLIVVVPLLFYGTDVASAYLSLYGLTVTSVLSSLIQAIVIFAIGGAIGGAVGVAMKENASN